MSPRFLHMIPFLWEWEGTKFENDPSDPGGATKFGVDQRSHPHEDIRNLTEERAKEIYWADKPEGWQPNDCEDLPFPLGEVFFNACVNCGPARARKLLEESGRNAAHFLDAQAAFYRRLVAARPKSQKYLKGWLNRIEGLRKYLSI